LVLSYVGAGTKAERNRIIKSAPTIENQKEEHKEA